MWIKKSEYRKLEAQLTHLNEMSDVTYERLSLLMSHLGLVFDKIPEIKEKTVIITAKEAEKKRKEQLENQGRWYEIFGRQQMNQSGLGGPFGMHPPGYF
jgi:hypothetical protein